MSATPVPKISAVAFGSAVGVIITIIFPIEPVGAAALTGALGTISGYIMPDKFPWKK